MSNGKNLTLHSSLERAVYQWNISHLITMRMSVSVISVYWISYWYRILLLNIGYWNNQLIWISVQCY